MVSLFPLLGCNLSYVVDLFAALHELASASACTSLKLASSVRALLKPYGEGVSIVNGGDRLKNANKIRSKMWVTRNFCYISLLYMSQQTLDRSVYYQFFHYCHN